MTKTQHLLIKAAEECAEIQKDISKALLFGLDDKEPGQPLTNRQKIEHEVNDLFAVVNMLANTGVIDEEKLFDFDAMCAKQQKVEK